MPLQPNIPFSDGDNFTPDLAYAAFNSPVFDDQPQYLGHRQKIVDGELSETAGQIKGRVAFLESSLKVSQEGTGLTIRYASGTIQLSDNTVVSIVSGVIGVPNNTISYVFVNIAGAVVVDIRLPVVSIPLARVTTSNSVITSIEDFRHPNQKQIRPAAFAVKTFGGCNNAVRGRYSG